jgi:hypothetical protein
MGRREEHRQPVPGAGRADQRPDEARGWFPETGMAMRRANEFIAPVALASAPLPWSETLPFADELHP